MLIKPYGDIIEEPFDPLSQSHVGVVVDNNDPEKLNRVKVSIDMWDHLTTEQLDWVRPKRDCFLGGSPDSTSHYIPEVGTEVRVTFPNGDERDPQYEGVEINEGNKCSLFDEYYPNTYGEKDSAGNFNITNKQTKITVKRFASGSSIQADPDGSISIYTPDELNYIRLGGDGVITIKGAKINIIGTDDIELSASKIKSTATGLLENNADVVNVKATTKATIGGTLVSLEAVNSIALKAASVVAQNFEILGAPGGTIFDLTSKEVYVFQSGVLTSKLP